MPCRVVRAFVCSAGLLLACVCVPAAAAPNLLTNGGFETFGAGQTVFSDSLPDLAAWTTVSGGFTLAGGILTSNGAGSSRDLAIVANSSDYTAGTMQAVITPVDVQPQLTGGVVSRYQGADDHYACGITKNSLVLLRRLAGVETTLGSTAFTSVSGTAYRVSLSAAGSSLTCRVQAVAGGATASTTATDGSFASGAIGLFSANANPTQVRRNRFSQPLMTATPPDGWSTIQTASGRPGLIPDVVSPVNSGVAYLQLFSGSAAFAGSSVQTVGAVGGFTYTLQGAIRTDAVAGTAQVMAVESPGGATTVLGDVSGTTPWTVYSTSFTTQPSTTQIAVRTRIAGSGRASFDDLSLSAATLISLSLSASSIDFGSVDPISAPALLTPALDAVVTANTDWQLTVAGDGDFADGTGETFPLSRLEWRVNGSGATFAPFATAGAFVSSGAATPVTGTATPLDLRLQVTYQDSISPVPFQTGLTYIATTP